MRLPLFVKAATFPTFVRAPRSKWLSCKLLLNRPPILTWHQLTPLLTRRTVFSKAGLLCLNSYCPVPFCAEIFCPPLLFLVCSCFHYFLFRCASISWFQVVRMWVINVFTASASTGLSDFFQQIATLLKHRNDGALYVHGMEVSLMWQMPCI